MDRHQRHRHDQGLAEFQATRLAGRRPRAMAAQNHGGDPIPFWSQARINSPSPLTAAPDNPIPPLKIFAPEGGLFGCLLAVPLVLRAVAGISGARMVAETKKRTSPAKSDPPDENTRADFPCSIDRK